MARDDFISSGILEKANGAMQTMFKMFKIDINESKYERKQMSNMKPILTPYLNFNGNTAEAMKFYQSILGGELIMQTFAEAGMAKTPEEGNRILHADLKNETLSFMASDGPPSQQVRFGDNIHMSISGTDQNKLTEFFNKLAQGGKADMPLAKQFWGDTFGMLTDKFGVHWMINITSQSAPAR